MAETRILRVLDREDAIVFGLPVENHARIVREIHQAVLDACQQERKAITATLDPVERKREQRRLAAQRHRERKRQEENNETTEEK